MGHLAGPHTPLAPGYIAWVLEVLKEVLAPKPEAPALTEAVLGPVAQPLGQAEPEGCSGEPSSGSVQWQACAL